MTATLVAELKQRDQQRRENVASWYSLLVQSAANDEAVDQEIAAETLEAAGKTPDDLAADVAHVRRRRELRQRLEQLGDVDAAYHAHECETREMKLAFDAANERFAQKMEQRRDEVNVLMARCGERDRLRAELSETADPEILADAARLAGERTRAADAAAYWRAQLGGSAGLVCRRDGAKREVERIDAMPANDPARNMAIRERHADDLAKLTAAVERGQAALAAAEADFGAADTALAELEQRRIEAPL